MAEPLPGANIMIMGTATGTSSDLDGYFIIEDIEPGVYTLLVSMVSYATDTIKNVVVTKDQLTTINSRLKEISVQLGEVVIVGDPVFGSNRLIHTDDIAMVSKFQESELNVTGISTLQIIRSADNNASDVIRRAASVTVINDFMQIRGLPDRYNFTFLNGMQAPSSKPDGRAFSLDLIPSGMIDNILIYRSPAPELPADFAGGVVDIVTKQSLPRKQLEISGGLSYLQESTNSNFYFVDSPSKTDLWGFDDGSRGIPSGFPDRLATGSLRTQRDFQKNAIAAREIWPNWNLHKRNIRPDIRLGVNYYDSWKIGKSRLSSASSINYTSTTTGRVSEINSLLASSIDPTDSSKFKVSRGQYWKDTISITNNRIGGFQSFNLKVNENNNLLFTAFFNQDGTERITVREGGYQDLVDPNDYSEWPTFYKHQINYTYNERTVFTSFLKGDHNWGEKKDNTIGWLLGYTSNNDNLPSERALNYFQDTTNNSYILTSAGSNNFNFDTQPVVLFYRNTNEDIYTGRLDLKYNLSNSFYIKVGAYGEDKQRNFSTNYYSLENVGGKIPTSNTFSTPVMFKADSIYNEWIQSDGLGITLQQTLGDFNIEFDSRTKLYAGYIGLNYHTANKKFTAYGGVRVEYFEQNIVPIGLDSTITDAQKSYLAPTNQTFDYFPSINLSYNFSDRLKLRSSYGLTINRPFERELVAANSYDLSLGYGVVGYSFLKPSYIQNADIRIEHYGGKGEMIALGAFYKKFTDPIELATDELLDPNTDLLADQFFLSNSKSAQNFGVELELRKNLSFISPKLENFSLIMNASLLRSRIQLSDSLERAFYRVQWDSIEVVKYPFAPGINRSLTGTSPYTFNVSLYYDNSKTNTTVSLQYNIIGNRIIVPPVIFNLWARDFSYPADTVVFNFREFSSSGVYEAPRHLLDLTIRQKLFPFLGLKFSVRNLLNQPVMYYFDRNRDEKYTPPPSQINAKEEANELDLIHQKFFPGRYYTISLGFVF
ncbi:MAG: TonB-dependent receptor [Cyclobacteriaceae bacterium]|nr:TonB-dependent receptor [Cyclobacteriaceae bacterium]